MELSAGHTAVVYQKGDCMKKESSEGKSEGDKP